MNKKLEENILAHHYKHKKDKAGGVKIGHHKKGAWAEIGQNRIRGGWGVKKTQKTSDIIYVRSLMWEGHKIWKIKYTSIWSYLVMHVKTKRNIYYNFLRLFQNIWTWKW